MKRKHKSRIQLCKKCGSPFIDEEKHAKTCPGSATNRGLKELCELCGVWYFHLDGHACTTTVGAKPAQTSEDLYVPNVPMNSSAAVIIARHHQSAPKEHWSDKVMREAAQDIVEGKVEGQGPGEGFWNYGQTQTVLSHPRVQDALRKLETEVEQARNPQELLEKTHMYREYNEILSKPYQWDGQGRWMGKENLEMRQGELLTPFRFMERLLKIVPGKGLELNSFAVLKRVAILIPDPEEVRPSFIVPSNTEQQIEILRNFEMQMSKTIDLKKQLKLIDSVLAAQKVSTSLREGFNLQGKRQVATLQYPLGTEWMIMNFDEYGVPTHAKYLGWRTALLSLITQNIVTEKEAHKAFPVTDGPASAWYREQLQILRNRGAIPS